MTTDDALVEKVARALDDAFEAENQKIAGAFQCLPNKRPDGGWSMNRVLARAAIRAMREMVNE